MRAYRKSRSELDALATQIVRGEVHIATEGEALDKSFGHIFALLETPPTERQLATIGAVYERLSKASPVGINGYPFFLSCQFVHVKDLKKLQKLCERKERALTDRGMLHRLFSRRVTTASGSRLS